MSLSSSILTIPGNAICVAKSVKLQDSKSITITKNGDTTILPDSDYDGIKQIIVTTNVSSAPKTASGSVSVKMVSDTTSFTCGRVDFTPVACGWSVAYRDAFSEVKGASYNFGGTSYGGVGVQKLKDYDIVTGKTTLSGSTISGSIDKLSSGAAVTVTVTVNWWAVGS